MVYVSAFFEQDNYLWEILFRSPVNIMNNFKLSSTIRYFLQSNPRVPVPTSHRVFEFLIEDHNPFHNTATKIQLKVITHQLPITRRVQHAIDKLTYERNYHV